MQPNVSRVARWRWCAGLAVVAGFACTIIEPVPPDPPQLQIVLDRDTLDAIADTLELHALIKNQQGGSSPADAVTWISSVGSVAQVLGISTLVSRGTGSTVIRAVRGALSDTATVVVR